jgi:hypothetical protein
MLYYTHGVEKVHLFHSRPYFIQIIHSPPPLEIALVPVVDDGGDFVKLLLFCPKYVTIL